MADLVLDLSKAYSLYIIYSRSSPEVFTLDFRFQKMGYIMNSIDFNKAFDSIDRKSIFAVLRQYGIPADAVCSKTLVHYVTVLKVQ